MTAEAPRYPDSLQRFTSSRSLLTSGRSSRLSSAKRSVCALPVPLLFAQ